MGEINKKTQKLRKEICKLASLGLEIKEISELVSVSERNITKCFAVHYAKGRASFLIRIGKHLMLKKAEYPLMYEKHVAKLRELEVFFSAKQKRYKGEA